MFSKLGYGASWLFRLAAGTLILIVAIALVNHFVITTQMIDGLSMFPNYHDRDVIILNKVSYVLSKPNRGDSVVLRFPGDPDHVRYIKRLIGLPGDTVAIRDGYVSVNGKKLNEPYIPSDVKTYPAADIVLGSDQYYLVGDNRDNSSDSRIWGPASMSDFIGKGFLIVWPLNRLAIIHNPTY